jgi:hypothetical protein
MDFTHLRDSQKVTILQKNLSSTKTSLDDLLFEKFGTNRRSEILAKIGNKNQGYEKTLTDYLLSL